jgi:3-phosphoshikimate 1-carboxyvinyltransferase
MTASDLDLEPVSALRGRLRVPGDKSISHRYVMFGALARGVTRVCRVAPGADVASTLAIIEALGAGVARLAGGLVTIQGRGDAGLTPPAGDLDAGNSGTTLRLMAGILAGQPFTSRLIGDESLTRRPMGRIMDPLIAMGARITAADRRPPLEISGGALRAIDWTTPVASAQVKSAILLAGLFADGNTTVREPLSTRDHTERAFDLFGIVHTREGLACTVRGHQCPVAPAVLLTVPGDPSSAAVWATAAAAIPGSVVEIDDVCLNPHRLGFIHALERMGADVALTHTGDAGGEPVGSIRVAYGQPTSVVIGPEEVPALIDELPVLAAAAALRAGLTVTGASELRVKESDRITALVSGFRALGLEADERPDGFVIPGGQRPSGGHADACGDHRLVMAFTLIALGARGRSSIGSADSVTVSYPTFVEDLRRLTP